MLRLVLRDAESTAAEAESQKRLLSSISHRRATRHWMPVSGVGWAGDVRGGLAWPALDKDRRPVELLDAIRIVQEGLDLYRKLRRGELGKLA